MKMKIRPYKNPDKKEIKKFISEILEEIFKSPASNLNDLRNIQKNFWLFLIAEENEKIVGIVGIKKEDNDARISRMYVKKNKRKKGIGTKLIQEVLKYIKKKNHFKRIFLTTYKQMGSVNFYKKFGFKIYKKGMDVIYMEKIL